MLRLIHFYIRTTYLCDLLETVKTNIILKTYRGLLNVTSMICHHEISSLVLEDLTFNKSMSGRLLRNHDTIDK